MTAGNPYYQFFKTESGFNRVSINDHVYAIEKPEQIKNLISDVLLDKILLDQTNKNRLLDALRRLLK